MSDDQARVDEWNGKAAEALRRSPDEAAESAIHALRLAEEGHYFRGQAAAELTLGRCELLHDRRDEGLALLERSAAHYAESAEPSGHIAALTSLGGVYQDQGRFERAMDHFVRALEAARALGDRRSESVTLCRIGEICLDLGDAQEALDYFLLAYETVPDDLDAEAISTVLYDIGRTYITMGNWRLAKDFTEKALQIASSAGYLLLGSKCQHSQGRISQAAGHVAAARVSFAESLALAERLGSARQRAAVLIALGSLATQESRLDEAITHCGEALGIAERLGYKPLVHAALERLAEAQELAGDFKSALSCYRSFSSFEREFLGEDAKRKIKNLEVRYEVEKSRQEAEIYRLRNIELRDKTEAAERANRSLLAISDAGRSITASLDLDTIISTLREMLGSEISFDLFGLALYDGAEGGFDWRSYVINGRRRYRPNVAADPTRSVAALSLKRGIPIFMDDAPAQRADLLGSPEAKAENRFRTAIFVPLFIDGKPIGVITLQARKAGAFTRSQCSLLESLAPYAAIAIENGQIHDRLASMHNSIRGENEKLERRAVEITHLANHDMLTGLPNRRLLFELVRKTFDMASRGDSKVGILYIDLDDFKPINDRFGHSAGDSALVTVAERLKSVLRASDTISRVGGDEFIAVISGAKDRDDIRRAAAKLVEECSMPFMVGDEECSVGLSMGIAIFPDDGESIEELVGAADAAMYSVKRSMKNGFAFAEALR